MKNEKFYFKSINDTTCYPLDQHIFESKEDGLSKIKLIEAIPDFENKEYIWCTYFGEVGERTECKKSCCEKYKSNRSGRGTCVHRGKLYIHGEEVEFDIE